MHSSVDFINANLALIDKGMNSVLVGRKDTTVLVVCVERNDIVGRPLILLAKECVDEDAAVEKHLYLVGKMCRKSHDSKYFKQACYVRNMSNGDFSAHTTEEYVEWAGAMLKAYHEG